MPDIKTLNQSAVPTKYVDLGDGSYAELFVVVNPDGSNVGTGGSGPDRELVVSTYRCKTAFSGASVGDTITATQVIDVSGASPSTVSTIWRNQATAADLASAPSAANLELTGTTALTAAQLAAAALASEATVAAINAKLPSQAIAGLLPVDTLAGIGAARQLAAGSSNANTALTVACRRISIHARLADIRYAVGTGAQTASATTHFIAMGERLDIDVPANAQIAVIRAGATDGVLEVSELTL